MNLGASVKTSQSNINNKLGEVSQFGGLWDKLDVIEVDPSSHHVWSRYHWVTTRLNSRLFFGLDYHSSFLKMIANNILAIDAKFDLFEFHISKTKLGLDGYFFPHNMARWTNRHFYIVTLKLWHACAWDKTLMFHLGLGMGQVGSASFSDSVWLSFNLFHFLLNLETPCEKTNSNHFLFGSVSGS